MPTVPKSEKFSGRVISAAGKKVGAQGDFLLGIRLIRVLYMQSDVSVQTDDCRPKLMMTKAMEDKCQGTAAQIASLTI